MTRRRRKLDATSPPDELRVFNTELRAALDRHGAAQNDSGYGYQFHLDTPAGRLKISSYPPSTSLGLWVHSRFDEPDRAIALLGNILRHINPYSGKWNFTSHKTFIAALDRLMEKS